MQGTSTAAIAAALDNVGIADLGAATGSLALSQLDESRIESRPADVLGPQRSLVVTSPRQINGSNPDRSSRIHRLDQQATVSDTCPPSVGRCVRQARSS